MGDRLYSTSHQWIEKEGNIIIVGITDFLQEKLGGIMFVNTPEAGTVVTIGKKFADIESKKIVFDLISVVSGTVVETNEELFDHPEFVNEKPYDSWLVKVDAKSLEDGLIDEKQYRAHIDKPFMKNHE